MVDLLWLIPVLPLLGFLVNGLFGKHLGKKAVGFVGVGVIAISFILALMMFFNLPQSGEDTVYYHWITVGNVNIDFALRLDHLSIIMTLVVTGVGMLIHIYSMGYIHHENKLGYARYFSYINLFSFAMLVLVLANNFLLMFVGWEGVGLCSYLLIGYWYHKDSASDAGKKAFIVNRIGDAGFLLAIFTILAMFGSLDFNVVLNPANAAIAESTFGLVPLVCLALFIGATGKSAQLPLYVWLPDAMEGPTPVSALIHAATMVTAGVYMVVRCNVLYALAPEMLYLVGVVGALTAIFAATIGIAQNDIKKVLAYSTVSQLGYMFFAAGMGAYSAAIFHLMTHAFFKACLFLGSGSVIHGMHEEQDMRKMGGLKAMMPITYLTMLISTLAIAGIPPFSGFFSKDSILWAAVAKQESGLWLLGALAAVMTSFYMFRLMYMTFSGKFRGGEELQKKVHESPPSMTGPLVVLAVLAIFGGLVGLPYAFNATVGLPYDEFGHFLKPTDPAHDSVVMADEAAHLLHDIESGHLSTATLAADADHYVQEAKVAVREHGGHHGEDVVMQEWLFMGISVMLALIGLFLARWLYKDKKPDVVAEKGGIVYKVLNNKYYVDEIYDAAIVNPIVKTSRHILWKFFDAGLLDGIAVNGSAKTVGFIGRVARLFHNGYVQSYLFFFLIGVLVILWIIF